MEDEQIIETEFCNNCKKDIPSVNFMMHTSHCSRNITLCDICNEPVRTSENDEHFQEYHEMVKCDCGESFEKMNLDRHKESECKCRKVVCEFCELELPFSEMGSHKEYCGSRTELCDKCNRYIKNKELEEHMNSDCQNELTSLQNNAAASTSQNRHKIPLETMIQNVDFGNGLGHEIDALQYEYGPLFDVENVHPQDFGPRNDRVVARGPNPQQRRTRARNQNHNDFDNDVDYARIMKQNQLEGDELIAALLACEQEGSHFDEPPLGSQRNQLFEHSSFEHGSSNLIENPEADSALDQTFLPCEFCGEAFKEDDLIQHQTGCQLTSVAGRSPGSFPNLRSQPRSLPPIDFNQFDNMAERDNYTDDYDDTLLPCEFCQELVHSDILFSHQSMCDPQRTRPSSVVHNEFSFETDAEPPVSNNSRIRTSTRPPRPSRPVINEILDEGDLDFPSSTESTETGTTVLSGNTDGFFIPRNNRNESYISDLLRDSSTSPKNDNRESRDRHPYSNGSAANKHSSKTSSRKQGSKKSTTSIGQKEKSDFTLPTRGTEESPDRNERSSQRRGSPKTTSSRSREGSASGNRSSGFRDVQVNEVSNLMKNDLSTGRDGTKTNDALGISTSSRGSPHTDQSLKHRTTDNIGALNSQPFYGKNRTSIPKPSESRKKVVTTGQATKKSEPFQHTQETRKQLSRLVPSSGKPQASTDSRRQDGVQRQPRKKKVEDTPPIEREGSRPNTEYKPRTSRKKIV